MVPIEAKTADDAIDLLRMRGDIRAILTDVQMLGSMNGMSLAVTVRDRWPLVGILATSGLTRVGVKDLLPSSRSLSKPSARQVAKKLRE